jgi:hypothetical protein
MIKKRISLIVLPVSLALLAGCESMQDLWGPSRTTHYNRSEGVIVQPLNTETTFVVPDNHKRATKPYASEESVAAVKPHLGVQQEKQTTHHGRVPLTAPAVAN